MSQDNQEKAPTPMERLKAGIRSASAALRDWPQRRERWRAALNEGWEGMEGSSKAMVALLVACTLMSFAFTSSHMAKAKLEDPYAKVDKIQVKGVISPTEKLLFSNDSASRIAKDNPEARIIQFVGAKKARGPVDRLFLIKTDKGTYPLLIEPLEATGLRDTLKAKDRIDALKYIDYETLADSEKRAAQGLALRLAPEDYQDEENIGRAALAFANFAITAVMILYLLQMLRQGKKSLKFIRPSKIKGSLSDLVGMEDIKTEVLRIKDFLANRPSYREYGIERPNNILFSGPPGTGKTKLAGYLAKELGLPILFHSAANLETGFVNGGSQTLDKALALAKKEKRCVIFLDEAQDLFMKRGQSGRKFDDDTQNTLLSILDGVRTTKDAEIIWIVASNFNSNTMEQDEAMLRRFQMKIDFRLPNPDERRGILEHYLGRARDKLSPDLDLVSAVHMTEQCSPADLESIAHEAGVAAINVKGPITTDILLQAAERHIIGNTDEATTHGRERDREIIAIHEVGHFLIDLLRHCDGDITRAGQAKDKVGAIKISLKANARSNALGFVLKKPSMNMLMTKRDMEWEVMTLFGGMANEEIFFGEEGVTNGAYGDITEVTKLLGRAVGALGVYKDSKVNFSVLANPRADAGPTEEDRAIISKVSQAQFERAKSMLVSQRGLSRKLADALIANLEMKSSEMIDLIVDHAGASELNSDRIAMASEGSEIEKS